MRALVPVFTALVLSMALASCSGADASAPTSTVPAPRAATAIAQQPSESPSMNAGETPVGTIWAWGSNVNGELGDGILTHNDCAEGPNVWDCSRTPVRVAELSNIATISGSHAQKIDGTIWSWGDNDNGQLGDGVTAHQDCGQYGTNDCSPTPVLVAGISDVIAISTSPSSGYALKSDGTVWAWGRNAEGQLGDGNTTHQVCTSKPFSWDCSFSPVRVARISDIVSISAADSNAYALRSDGSVWAWGAGYFGQLGDGSTTHEDCHYGEKSYDCSKTPVQVSGLTGVTAIGASGDGGYALKSDGTVWAWGSGDSGRLGDGDISHHKCTYGGATYDCSLKPVQVSGLTRITAITGSLSLNGYALKSDGTVYSWGDNHYGQLGDGSITHQDCWPGTSYQDCSPMPVRMTGLPEVTAIRGGDGFAYALTSGGMILAWGNNHFGLLGDDSAHQPTESDGSGDCSPMPVQVLGLENVIAISAGNQTGYALVRDA